LSRLKKQKEKENLKNVIKGKKIKTTQKKSNLKLKKKRHSKRNPSNAFDIVQEEEILPFGIKNDRKVFFTPQYDNSFCPAFLSLSLSS
jgi:hypothetical protein